MPTKILKFDEGDIWNTLTNQAIIHAIAKKSILLFGNFESTTCIGTYKVYKDFLSGDLRY